MIIKCIYLRDTLKKYIKKHYILLCIHLCRLLDKGSSLLFLFPYASVSAGFHKILPIDIKFNVKIKGYFVSYFYQCFSHGNGIYFNIATVCYGQIIQHYNNCL